MKCVDNVPSEITDLTVVVKNTIGTGVHKSDRAVYTIDQLASTAE